MTTEEILEAMENALAELIADLRQIARTERWTDTGRRTDHEEPGRETQSVR